MAGGLFAIDRNYYWEIGAYDEQMNGWGGENLEISFRVWQCGGTLETIPCSRVGHVFRSFHPYGLPGSSDTHGINTARMAEVWMDEYKELFYLNRRDLRNNPKIGDVTHRKVLRDKLACKSFSWYLEHVYPNKFVPVRDALAYGRFRNRATNLCLDNLQLDSNPAPLGVYGCHPQLLSSQYYMLSKAGELRTEEKCAEVRHSREEPKISDKTSKEIFMVHCHGKKREQLWQLLPNGQIVNVRSTLCLDTQFLSGGSHATVRQCDEAALSQVWDIEYREQNNFGDLDSKKMTQQQINLAKIRNKSHSSQHISRSVHDNEHRNRTHASKAIPRLGDTQTRRKREIPQHKSKQTNIQLQKRESLMTKDNGTTFDLSPVSGDDKNYAEKRPFNMISRVRSKREQKRKIKNKFVLELRRTLPNNTEEHLEVDIMCKHKQLYPNNTFVRDIVQILNKFDIKVINNGKVFDKNGISDLPKENLTHPTTEKPSITTTVAVETTTHTKPTKSNKGNQDDYKTNTDENKMHKPELKRQNDDHKKLDSDNKLVFDNNKTPIDEPTKLNTEYKISKHDVSDKYHSTSKLEPMGDEKFTHSDEYDKNNKKERQHEYKFHLNPKFDRMTSENMKHSNEDDKDNKKEHSYEYNSHMNSKLELTGGEKTTRLDEDDKNTKKERSYEYKTDIRRNEKDKSIDSLHSDDTKHTNKLPMDEYRLHQVDSEPAQSRNEEDSRRLRDFGSDEKDLRRIHHQEKPPRKLKRRLDDSIEMRNHKVGEKPSDESFYIDKSVGDILKRLHNHWGKTKDSKPGEAEIKSDSEETPHRRHQKEETVMEKRKKISKHPNDDAPSDSDTEIKKYETDIDKKYDSDNDKIDGKKDRLKPKHPKLHNYDTETDHIVKGKSKHKNGVVRDHNQIQTRRLRKPQLEYLLQKNQQGGADSSTTAVTTEESTSTVKTPPIAYIDSISLSSSEEMSSRSAEEPRAPPPRPPTATTPQPVSTTTTAVEAQTAAESKMQYTEQANPYPTPERTLSSEMMYPDGAIPHRHSDSSSEYNSER